MGKVPRPLEPLVNALGSLPTESYVLALKSAALHLQVPLPPPSLPTHPPTHSLCPAARFKRHVHTDVALQGRDEDIDPAQLSGKLGTCDFGESSLAQVCPLPQPDLSLADSPR